MFHLYSLKEPPPKRMCETINFANEVEATISSQESQPPPSQRQSVDSQRSCGDQYNRTIPTCGFQLSKKSVVANRIAHFNPRGFRNFPQAKKKLKKAQANSLDFWLIYSN